MKKIKNTCICLMLTVLCVVNLVMPAAAKEKWPKMPSVEAPSICVMEISTGTILYERNMDEVNYPASITKIMTALLALENSSLDETVTFSKTCVYGNEGNTSHISRDVDEQMTMEECLYGMMLESANECAWAIGEHVSGTMEQFTKLMNKRAKELGCTNTHFNNPNGLPDDDHWTSAHDMALIAAEAYKNETFRVIAGAKSYTIPPTNKHNDETPLHNHHKMVYPYHGDYSYLYDYATGGKTGYTNVAGNTLVTFAQKGDMALVCVVMREKSPYHYTDTRKMFDYCFDNFQLLRVAEYEKETTTDRDEPSFASVDGDAMVILPATADFSDLTATTTYDNADEDVLGTLVYSYAGHTVGQADIHINELSSDGYPFTESVSHKKDTTGDENENTEQTDIPNQNENSGLGTDANTDEAADNNSFNQDINTGTDGSNSGLLQGIKIPGGIQIEISVRNVAIAAALLAGVVILIFLIYLLIARSYLIRQKVVGMRTRRMERNRYRTIQDTRKTRRRGKREKKSKNLRF